ncbi:MAG: hypothetical protein CM1200mP28_00360 [Deltaproteobacteria bacterium]|nr:MAG: hypothetical protein CM1200mP28_00360 [Deltaproteobacteria bacterium]
MDYFLLGWSFVMEEVFDFELTEPLMDQLKKTRQTVKELKKWIELTVVCSYQFDPIISFFQKSYQ